MLKRSLDTKLIVRFIYYIQFAGHKLQTLAVWSRLGKSRSSCRNVIGCTMKDKYGFLKVNYLGNVS